MFESALLRRPIEAASIDAGLLAELLLFYQNVHLILDRGSLVSLVQSIGSETFLRLVQEGHLKASFFGHHFGASTDIIGGVRHHRLVMFHASSSTRTLTKEELIRQTFERVVGKSADIRKIAGVLAKVIPTERLPEMAGNRVDLIGVANDDLRNAAYVNLAAREILTSVLPTFKIPDNWRFEVHETDNGFASITNFDFAALERQFRGEAQSADFPLSAGHILSYILDASVDVSFSAKHLSELVTTELASKVISKKFAMMMAKRDHNHQQLTQFTDMALDGRGIRAAINSGERSFAEFVAVLDRAREFKHWLKDAHPEVGLIKEYFDAVTRESWVDKLPTRAVRFALFTGLGLVADMIAPTGLGTVGGMSVGAADAFVVDKLIKGWRPNQFVQGELRGFVNPQ